METQRPASAQKRRRERTTARTTKRSQETTFDQNPYRGAWCDQSQRAHWHRRSCALPNEYVCAKHERPLCTRGRKALWTRGRTMQESVTLFKGENLSYTRARPSSIPKGSHGNGTYPPSSPYQVPPTERLISQLVPITQVPALTPLL